MGLFEIWCEIKSNFLQERTFCQSKSSNISSARLEYEVLLLIKSFNSFLAASALLNIRYESALYHTKSKVYIEVSIDVSLKLLMHCRLGHKAKAKK